MLTTVHVHCPLCFTWANWSSKLCLSWCSQSLISIRRRTCRTVAATVDTPFYTGFPHCQWNSYGTAMRLFTAFLLFLSGGGFIGCKPSSQCPSGQFLLKNQCVLCHPTCSECYGHELFECTTCGVGKKKKSYPYFAAKLQGGLYMKANEITLLPGNCQTNCVSYRSFSKETHRLRHLQEKKGFIEVIAIIWDISRLHFLQIYWDTKLFASGFNPKHKCHIKR